MKAILDPFVFWLPPTAQVTPNHIADVLRCIDLVVSIGRRGLQVATTRAVWQRIQVEFVKALSLHVQPKDLAHRIRALQGMITVIEPPVCNGQTWGVSSLFGFQNIPNTEFWMTDIASLATYWIDNGEDNEEEFVFLTRLLLGRNLHCHSSEHCKIFEKTLWKVRIVSDATNNVRDVFCISSLRNLDVDWTIRYDDRLPDTAPGDGLSFTPPAAWRSISTIAVRTIRAKPAWIDAFGNGWADTSTPGAAHHWDVFLNDNAHKTRFGDDHVNITCWGTNDRGRNPGSVHH